MDVGVGILGGGTVGGALAHRLLTEREAIANKAGLSLELRYLVVRELDKPRPYAFPPGVLTDQSLDVVDDPTVQLVGGAHGRLGTGRRVGASSAKRRQAGGNCQ